MRKICYKFKKIDFEDEFLKISSVGDKNSVLICYGGSVKKAVFFAKVENPEILRRNEFYAVDILILEKLGFNVEIVTKLHKLTKADLYVVWWWTWAFFPVVIAKIFRRPVIVLGTFDHVMPSGELEYFPHRSILHKILIRLALKFASANIVVSMDQYCYLKKNFSVSELGYSPHVIDTDLYVPCENEKEDFLLLFCWMNSGNAKRKCVASAIRAMEVVHHRYPDIKLLIVGEKGDDYPELAAIVAKLGAGSYVQFLGVISKEDKITLMQRCKIYLQPTLAEGFGVAILEAMSCGAAVITSPVGAVPEVVGDCALMIDGADASAIATAICLLLNDPELLNNNRSQGRRRAVELFGFHRRLKDLESVILNSLNGK